jgi:hypothetical protein
VPCLPTQDDAMYLVCISCVLSASQKRLLTAGWYEVHVAVSCSACGAVTALLSPLILSRPKCDFHAVLKYFHKVPRGGHIFQSLAIFGPKQKH